MANRSPCPLCSRSVLESTLARHNGFCKRCFNQPRNDRYCALGFGAFAIIVFGAQLAFEAQIRTAAENGIAVRVHWLIATVFNNFGLTGVRILAATLVILTASLAAVFLKRWRQTVRKMAEIEANDGNPSESLERNHQ